MAVAGFAAMGMARSSSPTDADPPARLASRSVASIEASNWLDTTDRSAVERAYEEAFAVVDPPMEWTGDTDRCLPGRSSAELAQATIGRINFYRAMAGVPAVVSLDQDMTDRAQHAALMMSAEGELSHNPDAGYACFDLTGQEAAANSNLYLGRSGSEAIDGYIEDPGDGNTDVGHRLTVLHPPTTRMGVGHVDRSDDAYEANALWVFDEAVFDNNTTVRSTGGWVAWPPEGFVPERLVYPRWSLALLDADFSEAEVIMTVDGQPVESDVIERLSKPDQVPSSVLVWEPKGILAEVGLTTPSSDHTVLDREITVEVQVRGVGLPADPSGPDPAPAAGTIGAARQSVDFSYSVTILASPDDSGFAALVEASSAGMRQAVGGVASAIGRVVGAG